jgi:cytochrome P450
LLCSWNEALSLRRQHHAAAGPHKETANRKLFKSLGAMLAAKDPRTGEQVTETEVKDNVMSFIFGGQETTSSALTWAIYLLSQSPEWRERVADEAENVIGSP